MQSNNEKKEFCSVEKHACCNPASKHWAVAYADYFFCDECQSYCTCQPQNEAKGLTLNSPISELLNYIQTLETEAGNACIASEGTQGCDEANKMMDLKSNILKLLNL